MKKILVCGMLLGFLTTIGYAQRRAVEPGALPGRGHATSPMGANVGMGTNVGMSPSAPTGHDGISPSAVASGTSAKSAKSVGSTTTTVKPNAATSGATKSVDPNAASGNSSGAVAPNASGSNTASVTPNANTTGAARTVEPNANTTMDHVTDPNAVPAGDRAGVNPNQ